MSNLQLSENQNLQVVILEKMAKTMKFMRENQKKTMRDNLDDNRKGELKNDYQRKIKKRGNLDTHDKELLKNFEKKEREN